MSLRDVAAALRAAEAVRVFVSLDLIEEVAARTTSHLEEEALRTIRKKDTEAGKICLDKIDGVADFLHALKISAGSTLERQRGNVVDKHETPVEDRIAEIGRRRRARISPKVAAFQHGRKRESE